jgi:hypothetical protein
MILDVCVGGGGEIKALFKGLLPTEQPLTESMEPKPISSYLV